MKCCSLFDDWKAYEIVSSHVTSYHRNDGEVLDKFSSIAEKNFSSNLLKVTEVTWEKLVNLAELYLSFSLKSNSGYETGIVLFILHAKYLNLIGQDPLPSLRKAYDSFYFWHRVPKCLREFACQVMRENIGFDRSGSNLENVGYVALEAKSPEIIQYVIDYFNGYYLDPKNSHLFYHYCMVNFIKNPALTQLVHKFLPDIDLPYFAIDLFWNRNHQWIVEHPKTIFAGLASEQSVNCQFFTQKRLWAYYNLGEKMKEIRGLWNPHEPEKEQDISLENRQSLRTKKNILRVMSLSLTPEEFLLESETLLKDDEDRKVLRCWALRYAKPQVDNILDNPEIADNSPLLKSLAVRQPVSSVRKLASLLPFEQKIEMMLVAESQENAVNFLRLQVDSQVYNLPLCAHRRLLKEFLENPSDQNWSYIKKASKHLNAFQARCIFRTRAVKKVFLGQIIDLIWEIYKRDTESIKRKLKFIRSIKEDEISSIKPEVALEMLNLCEPKDADFMTQVWVSNSENGRIREILLEKCKDPAFSRGVFNFLVSNRNSSKILLAKDLALQEKLTPLQRITIQLHILDFSSNFPKTFLEYLHSSEMLHLWHLATTALSMVLESTRNNDEQLAFIAELLDIAEQRLDKIIGAILLLGLGFDNSRGPYIVNSQAEIWFKLFNSLAALNDPVISMYLQG